MPLIKKKKDKQDKKEASKPEEMKTTKNHQLSQEDIVETNQSNTNLDKNTTNDSEYGNMTDDPDDFLTSDEEKRPNDEIRGSDAETLPLEDDETTMDLSEDDAEKTHRRRKRKNRRPDDDNALLLSDRHVSSFNHNNYESNANYDIRTEACKSEEDGWSKDFEAVEDGKKGWETRCVIFFVIIVTTLLVFVIFFLFSNQTKAETTIDFRFANYFSDHMVLQSAPRTSVIWGYGPRIDEEQKVTVKIHKTSTNIETTSKSSQLTQIPAENRGLPIQGELITETQTTISSTVAGYTWRVPVGPLEAEGPYIISASLHFSNKEHVIRLYDVMIGDVWLCTGYNKYQNSIFKTSRKFPNSSSQFDLGNNNNLRIFSVFPAKSDVPWSDIHVVDIAWNVANADILNQMGGRRGHKTPRFPATCWYFGQRLQEQLKRPIGVVAATYSDSRLLEWAPVEVADVCGIPYNDASSRIWNGMLHPLINNPITGMVWQQASFEEEGNVAGHVDSYVCLLKGFVQQWRNYSALSWPHNEDHEVSHEHIQALPIGIIQALPSNSSNDNEVASLRWLASGAYGYLPNKQLPNSFLVTPIDLPDTSKTSQQKELAERLFKGAYHVAYKKGTFEYPIPVDWEVLDNGKVKMKFNMKVKIRNSEGLEVCCTQFQNQSCKSERGDHWERVTMSSLSNEYEILISSFSCFQNYIGFRYAWLDSACTHLNCGIYSFTGIPVLPFIRLGLSSKKGSSLKGLLDQPILTI